jgi:hypothetical protein
LNRKNFVSRRKRNGGERKYELLKGTWWTTLLFCEGVPELGFAIVLELHHPAMRTTVCCKVRNACSLRRSRDALDI